MATITETKNKTSNRSLAALFTGRATRPYVNPYLGGALLGLVLFLAFFITGNGLGASGGLNRILVYFEDLVAPAHVDRVSYLLTMAGGETNPLDSWIVMLTIGTVMGGFFAGWRNGRLKPETGKGPNISVRTRWVMAFVGGTFMGFGARMARLHFRPGAFRRRGPVRRQLGLHVRRFRRRICPGLFRPQTVAVRGRDKHGSVPHSC